MNQSLHLDSRARADFVGSGLVRALLVISPAFVALAVASGIEWGLLLLSSESAGRVEIELPLVWLVQLLVAGNLAVLCYATWLNTCFRARRSADESLRIDAGLSVCWVEMGWILYVILRLGSMKADEAAVPVLIMAFALLVIVIPLLWNAAHRFDRPGQSAWALGGFLIPAVALQLLTVKRLAAEPEIIFTIESAVIALAIAMWLIVYSLTSGKSGSRETNQRTPHAFSLSPREARAGREQERGATSKDTSSPRPSPPLEVEERENKGVRRFADSAQVQSEQEASHAPRGNIEHPTSNVEHPMSFRMGFVGCSMLGVRCSTFSIRSGVQSANLGAGNSLPTS